MDLASSRQSDTNKESALNTIMTCTFRIDHPSPLAADMVSTLTKLGVSTACMADADDG